MSSEEDPVAWLRNEIEQDHAFAKACLARPMFGSDLDAIAERIARCEAELAILDEHYILYRGDTNEAYEEFSVCYPPGIPGLNCGCVTCHYIGHGGVNEYGICRTVRLRAGGYKYRPGFPAVFAA